MTTDRHQVAKRFDTGKKGGESEPGGGEIQVLGTITDEPTPRREPAGAALDDPSNGSAAQPGDDDKPQAAG